MDEPERERALRAARETVSLIRDTLQGSEDRLVALLKTHGMALPAEAARHVATARTQTEFGKLLLGAALADLGGDPGTPDLRERLAAYAHDAWAGWMKYLFDKSRLNPDGSVTIPPALVTRWKRQMMTDYADLPADEQASDGTEADKMLALVKGASGT